MASCSLRQPFPIEFEHFSIVTKVQLFNLSININSGGFLALLIDENPQKKFLNDPVAAIDVNSSRFFWNLPFESKKLL